MTDTLSNTLQTRKGGYVITMEQDGESQLILIHQQGADGQTLVSALTPEQLVRMATGRSLDQEDGATGELRKALDEHRLEIVLKDRRTFHGASVSGNAEYKENRESKILRGATMTGQSPEEAAANLARELSGKLLVINAYQQNSRQEIQLPEFSLKEQEGAGRMSTTWKLEPSQHKDDEFILRVSCGPTGRTARQEDWNARVWVDREGNTRVNRLTNHLRGEQGNRYIKMDLKLKPGEINGKLADIAAQCSQATREMELWESTQAEREANNRQRALDARQALRELMAEGPQKIYGPSEKT